MYILCRPRNGDQYINLPLPVLHFKPQVVGLLLGILKKLFFKINFLGKCIYACLLDCPQVDGDPSHEVVP